MVGSSKSSDAQAKSSRAAPRRVSKENILLQLQSLLGDEYKLFIKIQGGHWNYEGENFFSIHDLLDQEYQEMLEFIDDLAERIRALGGFAPCHLEEICALGTLVQAEKSFGQETVQILAQDHRALSKYLTNVVNQLDASGDLSTADLLNEQKVFHDHAAWELENSVTH